MGMWDMTEIHIINRIEISFTGKRGFYTPVLLSHTFIFEFGIFVHNAFSNKFSNTFIKHITLTIYTTY